MSPEETKALIRRTRPRSSVRHWCFSRVPIAVSLRVGSRGSRPFLLKENCGSPRLPSCALVLPHLLPRRTFTTQE
jgi:hypothetical protein